MHASCAPLTTTSPAAADFPLSYPQRWMWVTSKLAGAACNLPLALRLRGDVRAETVEAALQDVVEHHQVLRTVFAETRGVPRQRVLEPADARRAVPVDAATESSLSDDLALAARRPFDLTRELPLDARLFRIGAADYVLLMNMHHIAADQWSLGLLTRDFSLAYSARHRGGRHDFPALSLQYVDYAAWQCQTFAGDGDAQGAGARQLAFWATTLEGMPAQIPLPASRTRQGPVSYQAGSRPIRLEADVHARLLALARTMHASLFMVVHAAVAAALTGAGAGTDVPICTPISGRSNVLLENLVGLFLNTLILRTDTRGKPTFRELLARVRGTDLDAYEHQDVPFELVIRSFGRARGNAGRPMIQACLIVNDAPPNAFELSDAVVRREPIPHRAVMFDLLFDLRARRGAAGAPAGIDGALLYSTDIFEPADVEPIADGVQRILRAASADADVPVSRMLQPE